MILILKFDSFVSRLPLAGRRRHFPQLHLRCLERVVVSAKVTEVYTDAKALDVSPVQVQPVGVHVVTRCVPPASLKGLCTVASCPRIISVNQCIIL